MKIIYTDPATGILCVVIPSGEDNMEDTIRKAVPQGVAYETVPDEAIPADRVFRGAWTANGKKVDIPVDKAKVIAHAQRRAARAAEFAPLDAVIAMQIPGEEAATAEAGRAAVRTKYAAMQTKIDDANTIAKLKAALKGTA